MADFLCESARTRLEALFAPGLLADKKAQVQDALESGDSLFFEGVVDWSLFLEDTERRLSGTAESLDDALQDILSCLTVLADDAKAGSEVLLGLTLGRDGDADAQPCSNDQAY